MLCIALYVFRRNPSENIHLARRTASRRYETAPSRADRKRDCHSETSGRSWYTIDLSERAGSGHEGIGNVEEAQVSGLSEESLPG
jgi:hypothetical protein